MLHPELSVTFPGAPPSATAVAAEFKLAIDDALVAGLIDAVDEHLARFQQIGLRGAVIGLSGGVDSAVACALLQRSRFPVRALVIEMDEPDGLSAVAQSGVAVAEKLGVEYMVINASALYRAHLELFDDNPVMTRVHLRSRVINNVALQLADNSSAIAVDTTDRSEDILKIYEESFRGHLAPLIDLYKSEVYDLADRFGLPELREGRSGCPELIDFDAFGMEWQDLDALLHLLVDQHVPATTVSDDFGVDADWLEKLVSRIELQPLRTDVTRIRLPGRSRPANQRY